MWNARAPCACHGGRWHRQRRWRVVSRSRSRYSRLGRFARGMGSSACSPMFMQSSFQEEHVLSWHFCRWHGLILVNMWNFAFPQLAGKLKQLWFRTWWHNLQMILDPLLGWSSHVARDLPPTTFHWRAVAHIESRVLELEEIYFEKFPCPQSTPALSHL